MIKKVVTHFMLERPVRNKSYAELGYLLEESGQTVLSRISQAAETEKNHRILTHLIGIEKWSQQRLRVALGDDFIDEEYDNYRPSQDADWSDLHDIFANTRAVTVGLTNELIIQNAPTVMKIDHNDFGPVSPRGWLRYIDFHGRSESKRVKRLES